MKVILLRDVQNLGKKYDIKEVKDGYARNFLLAKDLAKSVTKESLKWLKAQQEVMEKEVEEDLKKSQALASNLDGIEVAIAVKVGEKGELFESITSAKISEQLKAMGFEVKKSQIVLPQPLKETGEFTVKINLDHNLETQIQVVVSAIKE